MPDVTNQADKEPGLLWTDAQLWVQLCTVVGLVCLLGDKEKKKKEMKKEQGVGGEKSTVLK